MFNEILYRQRKVALKAKNIKTTATVKSLRDYGVLQIYTRGPDWSKEQSAQLSH